MTALRFFPPCIRLVQVAGGGHGGKPLVPQRHRQAGDFLQRLGEGFRPPGAFSPAAVHIARVAHTTACAPCSAAQAATLCSRRSSFRSGIVPNGEASVSEGSLIASPVRAKPRSTAIIFIQSPLFPPPALFGEGGQLFIQMAVIVGQTDNRLPSWNSNTVTAVLSHQGISSSLSIGRPEAQQRALADGAAVRGGRHRFPGMGPPLCRSMLPPSDDRPPA